MIKTDIVSNLEYDDLDDTYNDDNAVTETAKFVFKLPN